jgi:hypothetical protein
MNKIIHKNNIIAFWGILDLGSIAWYIGISIYKFKIPFYSDILLATQSTRDFGFPSLVIISYLYIPIFLSLIWSGILLIERRTFGAILAYIQTFFRLIAFIPASIFFILWPLKYIFDKPPVILGILLVFISESLKLWTVISWHKSVLRQKTVS